MQAWSPTQGWIDVEVIAGPFSSEEQYRAVTGHCINALIPPEDFPIYRVHNGEKAVAYPLRHLRDKPVTPSAGWTWRTDFVQNLKNLLFGAP